jgi:hypothetical protein
MFGWCLFSAWAREPANIILDLEGSQYHVYEWLQPIATEVTQDAQLIIVHAPLKLIFTMWQWWCRLLICQDRSPVCVWWIAATTSPFNQCTYKTGNHWRAVDVHFNVRSCQDLLPLIIWSIIIWTLSMPCSVIRTWLYGNAERSNIRAVVALIRLESIYYAK